MPSITNLLLTGASGYMYARKLGDYLILEIELDFFLVQARGSSNFFRKIFQHVVFSSMQLLGRRTKLKG
jgi:hypothetical protein